MQGSFSVYSPSNFVIVDSYWTETCICGLCGYFVASQLARSAHGVSIVRLQTASCYEEHIAFREEVCHLLQTLLLSLGFGLITASVLAIAAVGITLQFGVTNYLNLAYGDLLTFGAYIALIANQRFGLNIWIGLLAAIVLSGLLAWLINLFVLRPFTDRGTSRVIMLIVTVGVSLILQNLVLLLFGDQFQQY